MKKLILALSSFLFSVVSAVAQTPYYQGKTIRIVTGYPAGDVNDLWPRLITQHMGKYIPGNPNFIVQNMPGASSMIAANYVYSVAKPDGLTLGWIAPTLYFDQLVGRKEAKYDWAKYSFIGSPAQRRNAAPCQRSHESTAGRDRENEESSGRIGVRRRLVSLAVCVQTDSTTAEATVTPCRKFLGTILRSGQSSRKPDRR